MTKGRYFTTTSVIGIFSPLTFTHFSPCIQTRVRLTPECLGPSPNAGLLVSPPSLLQSLQVLPLFKPPSCRHGISKEDIHRLYTLPLNVPLAALMISYDFHTLSSLSQSPTLIDNLLSSLTRNVISHSPSKCFAPHFSPGWNVSLNSACCCKQM